MSSPRYFLYPFGQDADDLTAIPDAATIDGSVSYQDGWTPPYEKNLLTDPTALPIPRGQMNQLFLDITKNIQEYQQYGTPQWVTGNTVSYPIYARVYYSGVVYESQIGSNTNTPGTDDTWLVISGPSFSNINIQTITSTGTYTPSAGMIGCIVELQGPGGGGGGCTAGASQNGIGGGGGGGGYCRKSYSASEIGANAAVVLPAGGAGGSPGNAGTAGADATFTPAGSGAVLTAGGGGGGSRTNSIPVASPETAIGGSGGSATNGDVNIAGSTGSYGGSLGNTNFAMGMQGGDSFLGKGAPEFITSNPGSGLFPSGYGGGGGGSYTTSSTNASGTAGSNSICIVTEFLSA